MVVWPTAWEDDVAGDYLVLHRIVKKTKKEKDLDGDFTGKEIPNPNYGTRQSCVFYTRHWVESVVALLY